MVRIVLQLGSVRKPSVKYLWKWILRICGRAFAPDLRETSSEAKRKKLVKRLKLVEPFWSLGVVRSG